MKASVDRQRPRLLQQCEQQARVFSGGRAPQCLERQIERQITYPRRLEQLCAWLEEAAQELPPLRREPLFGCCLGELIAVENEVRQAEPESAGTPLRPPGLEPLQGAIPKPRMQGATTTPSLMRKTPQFPPRLRPPAASHAPERAPAWASRPLASGEQVSPIGKASMLPGQYKPSQAMHAWKERLAGRTRRSLMTSLEVEPAARLAQTGINGSLQPRGAGAHSRLGELEAQWATSLVGPAASLALLQRLAGSSQAPALIGAPERMSPSGTPLDPLTGGASGSNGRPAQAAPGATSQPASVQEWWIPAPSMDPRGFYPEAGSQPLPEVALTPLEGARRPHVIPPLAAENLPTLLPPQAVYDAPTPAASAAARSATRRDQDILLAQEDLSVLAERIKRILDEEARRHGINV